MSCAFKLELMIRYDIMSLLWRPEIYCHSKFDRYPHIHLIVYMVQFRFGVLLDILDDAAFLGIAFGMN